MWPPAPVTAFGPSPQQQLLKPTRCDTTCCRYAQPPLGNAFPSLPAFALLAIWRAWLAWLPGGRTQDLHIGAGPFIRQCAGVDIPTLRLSIHFSTYVYTPNQPITRYIMNY